MNNIRKAAVFGSLLLFGAVGCADLLVDNVNNPDRRRALATPGDVEGLVSGAYRAWYQANHDARGPTHIFSTQSFQHSSTAANFGMLQYSRIPREPIQNSATHADFPNIQWAWNQNYRALAAVAEGLRAIDEDAAIREGLGTSRVARARVYGKMIQGLAHGDIALVYDRGFVVDENVAVIDETGAPILLGEPMPYNELMPKALAYLDAAIAAAGSAPSGTTIPADWMGIPEDMTMSRLIQVLNSFKARYRANVARTPAERAAVNWNAVLAETGAGVKNDFEQAASVIYTTWMTGQTGFLYAWSSTWQQATYFKYGMADQSGDYQRWLALPLAERNAVFPGTTEPVLIVSPDRRFPRGDTIISGVPTLAVTPEDTVLARRNQVFIGRIVRAPGDTVAVDNRGTYLGIRFANVTSGGVQRINVNNAAQYSNAERGTWRWSQYHNRQWDATGGCQVNTCPEIDYDEMRLLAAEAHFRLGNLSAAVDSINVTRVGRGGLTPATVAGDNGSCVPRLPDGTCGNLFEQLKWESRVELWQRGPYAASWYFNGRGWGDLYRGTPLQFPIPADQIQVLGLGAVYTFGGVGGTMAAPQSTYAFPGE